MSPADGLPALLVVSSPQHAPAVVPTGKTSIASRRSIHQHLAPQQLVCKCARWRLTGVFCHMQTLTSWTSKAMACPSGEILCGNRPRAWSWVVCEFSSSFPFLTCVKLSACLVLNGGAPCCAGTDFRTSRKGLTTKPLPGLSTPACDTFSV